MTPFYSKDGVELYHGACKKVLPLLQHFDACVMDPPYGIGEAGGKNKSRGNLAVSKDYGNLQWDDKILDQESMQACLDCAKWHAWFGGNFYPLPPASCWLIWWKMNGSNDFADAEMAWTNLPKAVRLLPFMWNGFIRDGNDIRVHPTQKPVDVMRWCLSHLPADVETVCDPCCGSASTAIACIREGKRFVGIDSHEPYLEMAIKRIEDEFSRETLFTKAEKQAELFS